MKLKVGSRIAYDSGNLTFEILELDENKDWCKVRCTNNTGVDWEEDWDDLHFVYSAIEIGEYRLIDNLDYAQDETPLEMNFVIPPDYYEPVFVEKDLPPFKKKGFMRRRR